MWSKTPDSSANRAPTQRPSPPTASARDTALAALGYLVVRIVSDRFTAAEVARLRKILAQRDPRRP